MEIKLTVLALLIAFASSVLIGPVLIPLLRKLKFGQSIRKEGPKSHYKKAGTPTIGGLIFIFGTLISVAALALMGLVEVTEKTWILVLVFIGYAIIGLIDDLLIILYKKNDGLKGRTKLLLQAILAFGFLYIFIQTGNEPTLAIHTLNINANLGWFYGFFILFLLVGTSNAVNLTDGLDGLAGGLSVIAYFAYGLIAWRAFGNVGNGLDEVAVFSFALIGGLLGFLVYNLNPAKVFMGDTGSLSLGATLATVAILTRHELTLAIVGGVFVIETLSSIIQVISYKTTKRRVFLMAPIHHHFEMLGWTETQIVRMFWGTGFFLALLAIAFGVWS